MKKIIIGIVALFPLLATNSLAAEISAPKQASAAPSYNSGLGFGLAGYYSRSIVDTRTTKC